LTSSVSKTTATQTGPQHVGLLLVAAALAFSLFAALGIWQIERRAWKLDLMARVDQRVHADAVAAPGIQEWPQLSAAKDEYRRIHTTGTFTATPDTLVQAVTTQGSGFWVMSPLRLADGSVVMVNRGFVPPAAIDQIATAPTAANRTSTVTGLLRMTQPDGAFLRKNDPTNRRWYSRDVHAIAAAHGLDRVAPYFIDADASSMPAIQPAAGNARVVPLGGLTVIAFHNNHVVYALTWFTLAAMVAAATGYFSGVTRWGRRNPPDKEPVRGDDN
jgi:surfeit locus 1 family protein